MLTILIDLSIVSLKNFKKKSEETNDYIIPPGLFDVPKKTVLMDIPSCPKSEEFSKRFMKVFTDNKYDICIKWITKNIESCLNWKVERLFHHVWFTKVYVLVKSHKLVRL